jgi:hypothetical protein
VARWCSSQLSAGSEPRDPTAGNLIHDQVVARYLTGYWLGRIRPVHGLLIGDYTDNFTLPPKTSPQPAIVRASH